MREITITANDSGRRLDRFLRKYLRDASLGEIYKLIRKDVKVDGKRKDESYILNEGEILSLYLSDEVIEKLTGQGRGAASPTYGAKKAKRQFKIIYEDENILVADKPFGLLTHGDAHEKKNHLANQVKDYLIEQGEYDPRNEKVFSPAPANRIDRNTTGLVIFGKNSASLKALGEMIREDMVSKYYLTIVHGDLNEEKVLTGTLIKDGSSNKVTVRNGDQGQDGLSIKTIVRPIDHFRYGNGSKATLVEVQLVTGRSHQIRAHLASIGHPVIGDIKYASASVRRANEYIAKNYHLTTQLLHAYRLVIDEAAQGLEYLSGRVFAAPVPPVFAGILESMRSRKGSEIG
ncbi:MAG: RluA family pseudouridine synthase [Mogibacterium sp.]|nr:RluA family pseudouridine synthase [Mogibacterium sp.]